MQRIGRTYIELGQTQVEVAGSVVLAVDEKGAHPNRFGCRGTYRINEDNTPWRSTHSAPTRRIPHLTDVRGQDTQAPPYSLSRSTRTTSGARAAMSRSSSENPAPEKSASRVRSVALGPE